MRTKADTIIDSHVYPIIYLTGYWKSEDKFIPEVWYQIIEPLETIGILDDALFVVMNLKKEFENDTR